MTKRHTPETWDRVAKLAHEGYPPRHILTLMPQLNRRQVTRMLTVLRKQGKAPHYKNGYSQQLAQSRVKRGSIEQLLKDLSKEQRTWLFTECRKLSVEDLTEYLTELVRDAYEEYVEKAVTSESIDCPIEPVLAE